MRAFIVIIYVHSLILGVAIFAQTPDEMKSAGEYERAARKSYEAKSFPDYLANIEKASRLRPNHPRLIYNLASAYALNGRDRDALQALEQLARMGLGFSVEKDEDFKSLREYPKFRDLQKWFVTNRGPIGRSERAFELNDPTLITEGVAYDKKAQTFYVSSVHQRKIVAVRKDRTVVDFSKEADGLWGVFGMRVDPRRRHLFVTTMAVPAMKDFTEAERGRSAVFRYELETGHLVKKYFTPAGERHALGDLILDSNGRMYATDSASPVIYTIDPTTDELTEFIRSDNFTALQGLTIDPGGASLYVADYSKGVFRIDIASKQIVQLKPEIGITLLGIDGLYSYGAGGDLIAIQNGVNPNRVIYLSLSGDRIYRQKVIAAGHPDFLEPTLGVLDGTNFYFVANSQWPLVGEKGELDRARLKRPVVLKIDLKEALAP